MGRTLFEAVPVAPEVDLRLRRIESRIGRIEAALDELRDRVRDGVVATGSAIPDEAVRAVVRELGVVVADAVPVSRPT